MIVLVERRTILSWSYCRTIITPSWFWFCPTIHFSGRSSFWQWCAIRFSMKSEFVDQTSRTTDAGFRLQQYLSNMICLITHSLRVYGTERFFSTNRTFMPRTLSGGILFILSTMVANTRPNDGMANFAFYRRMNLHLQKMVLELNIIARSKISSENRIIIKTNN